MTSLADSLKNNIVVVASGVAVAAFGAGWAAYEATVNAGDQVLVARSRLDELTRLAATPEACNSEKPNAQSCRAVLGDFVPRSEVERDYVPRAQQATAPKFVPGNWRHIAMPGASGDQVAERLSEIGPAEDSVVVMYDSSANNTFHIWYTGGGTGATFRYEYGQPKVMQGDPTFNYFRTEPGLVPAGIGGMGNDAVPIYFRVRY